MNNFSYYDFVEFQPFAKNVLSTFVKWMNEWILYEFYMLMLKTKIHISSAKKWSKVDIEKKIIDLKINRKN